MHIEKNQLQHLIRKIITEEMGRLHEFTFTGRDGISHEIGFSKGHLMFDGDRWQLKVGFFSLPVKELAQLARGISVVLGTPLGDRHGILEGKKIRELVNRLMKRGNFSLNVEDPVTGDVSELQFNLVSRKS